MDIKGLRPAGYLGVDGAEVAATTCEICRNYCDILVIGPCAAGNGLNPHRHLACPVCWRALHAHALLHGGQGAIAWQN